ncbi:hypothetical protein ABZU76_18510 [Amycolatopsis sp. NPDC005232]|uniref:hypothetical protein n=1 Tax=Amycolatopsis sp. NPDC005232 TaxID=3157027 RepID=UPI0033A2F23A
MDLAEAVRMGAALFEAVSELSCAEIFIRTGAAAKSIESVSLVLLHAKEMGLSAVDIPLGEGDEQIENPRIHRK